MLWRLFALLGPGLPNPTSNSIINYFFSGCFFSVAVFLLAAACSFPLSSFFGGSAGHNGIESIDKFIGKDYSRVRIGIGHPKEKKKVNSHVLEDFKEDEETKIQEITENIVKLVPTLIEKKIDLFSSKVNKNLNGI